MYVDCAAAFAGSTLILQTGSTAMLWPPALEPETVRDDRQGRERHRGAGQDRRELDAPDRIERASRDRDQDRVIAERPDEVFSNHADRPPRELDQTSSGRDRKST